MDYRGVLWSRVGMTASLRIVLIIAQATLMMVIVAAIAIYALWNADLDRRLLYNHARQAQVLSESLDVMATSGGEAIRLALGVNLEILEKVLDAQERRSASYRIILCATTCFGLIIVAVMSYVVMKNIRKKFPELREER